MEGCVGSGRGRCFIRVQAQVGLGSACPHNEAPCQEGGDMGGMGWASGCNRHSAG